MRFSNFEGQLLTLQTNCLPVKIIRNEYNEEKDIIGTYHMNHEVLDLLQRKHHFVLKWELVLNFRPAKQVHV